MKVYYNRTTAQQQLLLQPHNNYYYTTSNPTQLSQQTTTTPQQLLLPPPLLLSLLLSLLLLLASSYIYAYSCLQICAQALPGGRSEGLHRRDFQEEEGQGARSAQVRCLHFPRRQCVRRIICEDAVWGIYW